MEKVRYIIRKLQKDGVTVQRIHSICTVEKVALRKFEKILVLASLTYNQKATYDYWGEPEDWEIVKETWKMVSIEKLA